MVVPPYRAGGFKIFILLFKNKKYWGRLGNLVLICEILWLLFGVWCGLLKIKNIGGGWGILC